MSVEFKDQGFPGWFQDDPNKPTILRANVTTLRSKTGALSPIVAEFNYADGSTQYYEVRGGVGFNGPRVPLFTQSASGAKTVQNQGNLNELKPEDITRVEASVKPVAFKANQQLATAKEKEDLRNSTYYQSQANATPTGQRAPGETPQTPSASDTEGESGEQTTNPLTDENKEFLNKGIETKGVRGSYGDLRYPLELNSGNFKQDVIKFTMKSYGTRSLSGKNLTFEKRKLSSIAGSAVMSIQPRISDSNSVTWSGSGMDAIAMGMANASLNIIEGGFAGTEQTINELQSLVQSEKNNLETAIKIKAAEAAASTQNLLSRLTGGVLNPNLELLFEGPALRTFNYSFELSPRSKAESEMVRKIIRFFKQGMAVQRSTSELFLKAPNVFDIQYLYKEGDKDHPYINKIKGPCALTNCSVDYTPSGSYMTFEEDGGMISYNLSLTFEELEPIYADDYDGSDSEIGF